MTRIKFYFFIFPFQDITLHWFQFNCLFSLETSKFFRRRLHNVYSHITTFSHLRTCSNNEEKHLKLIFIVFIIRNYYLSNFIRAGEMWRAGCPRNLLPNIVLSQPFHICNTYIWCRQEPRIRTMYIAISWVEREKRPHTFPFVSSPFGTPSRTKNLDFGMRFQSHEEDDDDNVNTKMFLIALS